MAAPKVFQIVFLHSCRVGVGGNYIKLGWCVTKTATLATSNIQNMWRFVITGPPFLPAAVRHYYSRQLYCEIYLLKQAWAIKTLGFSIFHTSWLTWYILAELLHICIYLLLTCLIYSYLLLVTCLIYSFWIFFIVLTDFFLLIHYFLLILFAGTMVQLPHNETNKGYFIL